MPTKIGIWNEALAILGRQPVSTIDPVDDATRALADHWTRVPDAVLEEQNWNSSIRRVQLQRLADGPTHGYRYFYQMPRDWMRIVELNDTGGERDVFEAWRQENDKIATDADQIYLWYVASALQDEAIGRWSQALADYVSAKLALRMVPRFAPKSMADAAALEKKRRRLAMALDAMANPPKRHTPGMWSRSRLGGIRNETDQGR